MAAVIIGIDRNQSEIMTLNFAVNNNNSNNNVFPHAVIQVHDTTNCHQQRSSCIN